MISRGILLSLVLLQTARLAEETIITDIHSIALRNVKYSVIFYLWNLPAAVEAIPPIELQAKLKEKIKKGKELLENLNDLLEKIKTSLKKKKKIEQTTLEKIVEVKEEFKKLQVDSGDLPKELLDNFKEKTLEAFMLILQSYGLGDIPLIKTLEKAKDMEMEELAENLQDTFSGKNHREL
ncbi:uncharacterized protein LOC129222716 [Uloborus diversus]|uniref:uncharacterized protein LOC129222716 n=1 Tax=Uloborus diversus TaxID=327109 RepID=UPI002409B634|nr:uncharacterized protein LOC129222716 [Uloborus diversus]